MSWYVADIENTVKIPKTKVKEANASLLNVSDYFENIGQAFDKSGRLVLDPDAGEWIDPFDDDLMPVLLQFEPQGKLLFGSLEGDNAGDFWGYEFDGKGGVKELTGRLHWTVDESGE